MRQKSVLVEQIHTSRFLATNYQHAYMHPDRSHPSRSLSLAISYTQQLVPRVGGGYCWENNGLGQKKRKKWKRKTRAWGKKDKEAERRCVYIDPCATHSTKLLLHFYLKKSICVLLAMLLQFNPSLGNCATQHQQSKKSPHWFPIAARVTASPYRALLQSTFLV